jgi:hypothetical protein
LFWSGGMSMMRAHLSRIPLDGPQMAESDV